jgi:predicted signal transduction protein with EAL and GGDEF domain
LLYLKHFPVDRIKIDQSFVAGLGSDFADTAIVASTIALAHSIGIQAVAEGVETTDQLAILRQMGCDYAQGFLISRPIVFEALIAWLDRYVPARVEPREATVRDHAADVRDEVATNRDDVATARDRTADQRDAVADERDRTADERDAAADDRDASDTERNAPAPGRE